MFLIVTEDGAVYKKEILEESDFNSADDGYISIINIEDKTVYVDYDEWVAISVFKEPN